MASRELFISMLALVTLVACARNEDAAPAAAATVRTMELAQPGISIARDTYVLARGGSITEIAPLNTGGRIRDCVVSPALPAGLSLDKKYCVISGTPTTLQAEATYTVVAENQYGTSSIDLRLAVGQGLLEGLFEQGFNAVGYKSSDLVGSSPVLNALVPQAGGKMLYGYSVGLTHKWVRYNADGTKDSTSLNMLGSTCSAILSEACELGGATALANGRIVVAYVGQSNHQVRIARYLADGVRDTSFGTSGIMTVTSPAATAVPTRLRELASGKLVVLVELVSATAASGKAPAVLRLNANGSLDGGFGNGGVAFVDGLHHANSMDVDTVTGKIYVGGALAALPADEAFVVLGANGVAETGAIAIATGSSEPHDLVFDSSARKLIVVTNTASFETRLARYNANGGLDSAFGTGGVVTRTLGADNVARRARIDRWGNIFVLGNEGFGASSYFTVSGFAANGETLAGFGTTGAVTGVDPAAHALSLAEFSTTGKLVLAGFATTNAAIAVLK